MFKKEFDLNYKQKSHWLRLLQGKKKSETTAKKGGENYTRKVKKDSYYSTALNLDLSLLVARTKKGIWYKIKIINFY